MIAAEFSSFDGPPERAGVTDRQPVLLGGRERSKLFSRDPLAAWEITESANLAEPARARLPIVVAFLISVGIPLLLGYFISPEIREWIFKGFVVVFVAALAAPFVIYAVYYVRYRLHQRRKRRSTNSIKRNGLAGAFC